MWLDNLKELKKAKGMTAKQIAITADVAEKTVERIFSGITISPSVDTLRRIATALGASLDDIFVDTKVVVATETVNDLRDSMDVITAQNDLIIAENEMLKTKILGVEAENALLKSELAHKEELLALHNLYQTHIKKLINKGEL